MGLCSFKILLGLGKHMSLMLLLFVYFRIPGIPWILWDCVWWARATTQILWRGKGLLCEHIFPEYIYPQHISPEHSFLVSLTHLLMETTGNSNVCFLVNRILTETVLHCAFVRSFFFLKHKLNSRNNYTPIPYSTFPFMKAFDLRKQNYYSLRSRIMFITCIKSACAVCLISSSQ